MYGESHDLAENAIRRPAQPYGMQATKNLLMLILHNAAQDASGRLKNGTRGSDLAQATLDAKEARRWLLADDEHPPAIFVGNYEKVVQGASCRWILRELGIDPDLAQQQMRRLGFSELCNRLTIATRGIRRGPESAPRKYAQEASDSP